MSVSWWQRVMDDPARIECDVCIVGGGIAGLSAADEAARLGHRVVVLERHRRGSGASSRNAGYLMRGMAESYAAAARELGRQTAREIWQRSERNLMLLIDRFGIDELPSFERRPSSLVAIDDDEAQELRRSAEMLEADGFRAEIATIGEDSLWRSLAPSVALVNPGDAAINPAEMIEHIGRCVGENSRVRIIEQAEVFGITRTGDRAVVRAGGAEIVAGRVLICTNAAAGELVPELRSSVRPNRGQMLAIRVPGARLDHAYYLDRGSEYIRQGPHGTVVVGGMRKRHEDAERTAEEAPTPEVQGELERFAERVLGRGGEVVARWAGTMGFTADGLPIVSAVRLAEGGGRNISAADHPPIAMFCGGFTGHGMSIGAATAIGAVRRLLEADQSDDGGGAGG